MEKPGKVSKILVSNLIIFIVLLLPLEMVWRIYFSNDIKYTLYVLTDTEICYDVSNLYKTDGGKICYSRDHNGFRGEYTDASKINMIVLGGSTTDQRYIDNKQTWDRVLRDKYKNKSNKNVVIVNAGVDGQSTYGYLKNFDLWFPNIKNLNPEYVLFYIGINDFFVDEGLHYDKFGHKSAIRTFVRQSIIYHFYRTVVGMLKAKEASLAYNGRRVMNPKYSEKTDTPLIKDKRDYEIIMEKKRNAYKARLIALAKKTRDIHATPIFVTQRFSTYWIENNKIFGVSKFSQYEGVEYNGVDLHYMIKLLNKTTMDTCKEIKGICVDLESELSFTHDDFYDHAHNTPSGTYKIGNYLHGKLKGLHFQKL